MKSIQIKLYLLCLFGCLHGATAYIVGVGRGDCTGPPVEIVFVSLLSLFDESEFLNRAIDKTKHWILMVKIAENVKHYNLVQACFISCRSLS